VLEPQWTRRSGDTSAGDASAGDASAGVELVEAEVRKHSGEWNILDIAMFFTGRLAPFRS
jgi:hypothetical protein